MAKRGSALTKKLSISDELADFMGKSTASRAEVTKAIWAHIKKYELQDEDDKRTIIPDEALEPILGKKPINMMKMTGVVSKHFLKD
jgi:chromatin remodeling complex protein RSC6